MSSHFWIRTLGPEQNIAHIFIAKSLDTMTAYHLQEEIRTLLQSEISRYIINFEDVHYVSSAGIQVLYHLQHELQTQEEGRIILTKFSEKISRLFDKIGIMTMFEITDTVEQAVEQITPDEDTSADQAHGAASSDHRNHHSGVSGHPDSLSPSGTIRRQDSAGLPKICD